MLQMRKHAGVRLRAVVVGMALLIAGCSGGGGSGGGGGDDSGGGGNITVQALGGGTATLADGTYQTACRTCEDPSDCSDYDVMTVSGATLTFTTYQFSPSLTCGGSPTPDGPETATVAVVGTQTAGCFDYTPTSGGIPVPACVSSPAGTSPTASQITAAISPSGTYKTLAVLDTSGTVELYLTDDRGAGGPNCDTAFCTDLSTFPWVKQ